MKQPIEAFPEVLLDPDCAEVIHREVASYPDVKTYVEAIRASYEDATFMSYYKTLSAHATPSDTEHGGSYDPDARAAFVKGELLALRVVEVFEGRAQMLRSTLEPLKLKPDQGARYEGTADPSVFLAEQILSTGDDGYSEAKPFHGLLEDWMPSICPERANQRYILSGFGVVLTLVQEAEKKDRESEIAAQMVWGDGTMKL